MCEIAKDATLVGVIVTNLANGLTNNGLVVQHSLGSDLHRQGRVRVGQMYHMRGTQT